MANKESRDESSDKILTAIRVIRNRLTQFYNSFDMDKYEGMELHDYMKLMKQVETFEKDFNTLLTRIDNHSRNHKPYENERENPLEVKSEESKENRFV